MLKSDLNRREFLKLTAGAGAVLAMPTLTNCWCLFLQNDRHPGGGSFVRG